MSDIYDVSSDDLVLSVWARQSAYEFYNIDGKKYFKPNQAA